MSKKSEKAYGKMTDEAAHSIVIGCYHKAMEITDSVYIDILLKVRQEIDEIVANRSKEGGEQ